MQMTSPDIIERECCAKAALYDDWVAAVEKQRAEIERLRADLRTSPDLDYLYEKWFDIAAQQSDEIDSLKAKIERLRAALQKIVDEADSDDGLTAWDGSDIARVALEQKP